MDPTFFYLWPIQKLLRHSQIKMQFSHLHFNDPNILRTSDSLSQSNSAAKVYSKYVKCWVFKIQIRELHFYPRTPFLHIGIPNRVWSNTKGHTSNLWGKFPLYVGNATGRLIFWEIHYRNNLSIKASVAHHNC